jgi:hypothetical protein
MTLGGMVPACRDHVLPFLRRIPTRKRGVEHLNEDMAANGGSHATRPIYLRMDRSA